MKRAYRWWTDEERKDVLNLYIKGMSYDKIAKRYGVKKESIKSLLYRSRDKKGRSKFE